MVQRPLFSNLRSIIPRPDRVAQHTLCAVCCGQHSKLSTGNHYPLYGELFSERGGGNCFLHFDFRFLKTGGSIEANEPPEILESKLFLHLNRDL